MQDPDRIGLGVLFNSCVTTNVSASLTFVERRIRIKYTKCAKSAVKQNKLATVPELEYRQGLGGGIRGAAPHPQEKKFFYLLYFSFLYNDSVVRVSASYSSSTIVCYMLLAMLMPTRSSLALR